MFLLYQTPGHARLLPSMRGPVRAACRAVDRRYPSGRRKSATLSVSILIRRSRDRYKRARAGLCIVTSALCWGERADNRLDASSSSARLCCVVPRRTDEDIRNATMYSVDGAEVLEKNNVLNNGFVKEQVDTCKWDYCLMLSLIQYALRERKIKCRR